MLHICNSGLFLCIENGTCEDDDLAACEKLEEKYDMVNSSFEAFKTLLDMTVVNVLLREENRNRCMVSKSGVQDFVGHKEKGPITGAMME